MPERRSRAPEVIAPIDDGSDAVDVAERLLLAAPRLNEVYIEAQGGQGPSPWLGQLSDSRRCDRLVRLSGSNLKIDLDVSCALAVSYCGDRLSRGVRVIGETGPLLTFWSTRPESFEHWLERTLPEYACRIDKRYPQGLLAS